jgi:acyl carrier protein
VEIEKALRGYIAETLLDGSAGGEPGDDENLIGTGQIDSLGLLKLVGYVQQHYGVDLMAVGGPDDLESIRSLAAAIRRHGHA